MTYNHIAEIDTKDSKIALGCWAFAGGSNWGPQNDEDSINTVDAAISHGISFLDTAEGYGNGHSERVIGQALKNRRHEVVIATKPAPARATYDELQKACDESLKRLGTDYIDLYQQHWPNHDIPFEETSAVRNACGSRERYEHSASATTETTISTIFLLMGSQSRISLPTVLYGVRSSSRCSRNA